MNAKLVTSGLNDNDRALLERLAKRLGCSITRENGKYCDAIVARMGTAIEEYKAVTEAMKPAACASCKGMGVIADGIITGEGGHEFVNGPVECVRDCLDCKVFEPVRLPKHRRNRIYIAGPMTGLPDSNFPAFHTAARKLRAEGWHVENPAEHGIVPDAQWGDYLRWDLRQLMTCSSIYLLPGWESSKGASIETSLAHELELEFVYDPYAAKAKFLPKITKLLVPDITDYAINGACWEFLDNVNREVWIEIMDSLKEPLHKAVCYYLINMGITHDTEGPTRTTLGRLRENQQLLARAAEFMTLQLGHDAHVNIEARYGKDWRVAPQELLKEMKEGIAGKLPPVRFNPYTGEPRSLREIERDPNGFLIVSPKD